MNSIVFVNFECNESTKVVAQKIWQYDYGQILRIQGLNLPAAVEIHFSLQKTGGAAKRRIGVTRDGVTDVVIPDFILTGEGIERNYSAYAFVYLSDEESGQTEHRIELNITSRPEPEGSTSSDDTTSFGAIMDAVNKIAEQGGQGVSDEKIAEAVNTYMEENPVEGANVTAEKISEVLGYTPAKETDVSQLSDTVNDMKENGTGTTVTGGSVKTILENIMAIIRAGDIAYTSDISEIANKTDVLIANLGVIDDGSGNGNGSDESGSDSEIKSSTQFYFTGANENNYGVVGQVIECKAGETYYWNGIFSTQTAQIHETTMLSALPNTDSLYDTSITIGDTLTANEDGGYTATNDGAMFFPAMFTKGSNVEGYIADNYAYLGKGSWIIQNTPF